MQYIIPIFHEYRNIIVGVWAARARRVDKAKSYNYVTRALSNVREKNVRDHKVFKVQSVVGRQ